MKRSHFRLKVDLSNFFHDARRFCWVFIDGTKIQQVIHMKQHISKLFNIEEPFHLLLNNTEYLPPIEDVRILQENETILLVQLYFSDILYYGRVMSTIQFISYSFTHNFQPLVKTLI